jgi:hypothetical protein
MINLLSKGQSRSAGSNLSDEDVYDIDGKSNTVTYISMFQPQLHAQKEPILYLIDFPTQSLFTTKF